MSYYRVLGLEAEPFSTSPDPALFYPAKGHRAALYRLLISIKLRRGLNVILGDVGAGKTTLSRRFVQLLAHDPAVSVQMMLNPLYTDECDFLREVCRRFGISPSAESNSVSFYYREIENFLFKRGVDEGKSVVLVVDEAQKLTDGCLEALRGLLNYETNEYKIFQVVLVGQNELAQRLMLKKNFWDRIATKQRLAPLEYEEMREMINYRLGRAGYSAPIQLFSEEAMQTVYRATGGSPRQVTQLCHDCLEQLVTNGKSYVDRALVENLVGREAGFLTDALPKETDQEVYGPSRIQSDAGRTAV